MDAQVISAMARWPDVPAVYGWLSLSESGQWRLHPGGDAAQRTDTPGEAITSPQILAFMDRNYAADDRGCWYFQNGPQRVYVRLDAAPFIAQTASDTATGKLKLRTHTGLDLREIDALYLDAAGRLYVNSDRGPALVAGRDLPALLDAMTVVDDGVNGVAEEDLGERLLRCIDGDKTVMVDLSAVVGFPSEPLPLQPCAVDQVEERLGFRRLPMAG